MIVQERISETLVKSYSDQGVMIHGGYPEADYAEVVDPISAGRTYTETNIPIELPEPPENLTEASEYLLKSNMVTLPTETEPDYLNEHEQEPNYFNEVRT